jgi:hypothetical protein
MSTYNDIDIECTHCAEGFRGTIWVAIHAGVDPELKELLLGGELNLVSCPKCGHVQFHERFLIYQDPAAELIAYVYPESQSEQAGELRKNMLQGFAEAQSAMPAGERLAYDPILVFGLEDLIEMLHKEEALAVQSQVAQAICKEQGIASVLLPPSRARRLQIMRLLPRTGKGRDPSREDVLAGLDQLLQRDPVLDLYGKLRSAIQADPKWSLERPVSLA